ncbi:hypothetical protein VNO78_08417 [Psophocarpus tetragonolobus]|uniref:Secreted protein n=1 Tax=Psophocarpus tetragonolobus TaxID=3891 RepID=A0AAN9SXY2_PSOTE
MNCVLTVDFFVLVSVLYAITSPRNSRGKVMVDARFVGSCGQSVLPRRGFTVGLQLFIYGGWLRRWSMVDI